MNCEPALAADFSTQDGIIAYSPSQSDDEGVLGVYSVVKDKHTGT